jgi:hypothetical protein
MLQNPFRWQVAAFRYFLFGFGPRFLMRLRRDSVPIIAP